MRRDEKIVSPDRLAELTQSSRATGAIVVVCHGVFDLLHIGHIRYLQQARRLGDVLVVTVTPDRHVNKGPHRPAFTETLRAEALAALDCVDYVAINEWPTAVETIRLLRPHVYAKGAEFRNHPTPEILREQEALAEIGGEMAFIEDLTSSSSYLLNKHLSPFPEEVQEYLERMAREYGPAGILGYVEDTEAFRALVVGETSIEEYQYCQVLNRSAKAPVLAMQYLSHERWVGGAAAIANHVAAVCDEVALASVVGALDDQEGWVRTQLAGNITPTFVQKADSPTIIKRRYIESYFALPVFEVYVMNDQPLNETDDERLCAQLAELASGYDLVVVADHGHGMLSDRAIRILCEQARFLAVNTQVNAGNMGYHTISKYPRADYVCLAEHEIRVECRDRSCALEPMIEDVAGRLNAGRMVVTRGKHGCLGYDQEHGFQEAPALATRVVDRIGAGDAFLAITALCAAQSVPLDVALFLGNVAAAEAVATVGHRQPLEKLPLRRHVESLLK